MSTTTPSSSTITTNTTLTAGPPPSSPTSISTSSSLPTNTSPGSSTAPPTGNTTTLSPSTTTPGVTTITSLTHSTEPASGNTTASSTTTPISTTTISTGTTINGTTQRPTDTTANSFTTTPTSSNTVSTSTTINGTTQRPTDTTTNSFTTTPTSTDTVSTSTTINGTTQRPTDTTANSFTTTPTSTDTVSTSTTINGTTQRPTDTTTNSFTTTPTSTDTVSTSTTINGTTQRPTDTTTNSFTTTPTSPNTISTGTTTTAATTTLPVIVCPTVRCPPESVCLNGTCQCFSGSFLVNGRCEPGQVFPGQLHLTSLTFQNDMSNRSSEIFRKTETQISAALRDALKNQPGYKRSEVVKLQPGSVQATVNNIFENTTATQEIVDQAIVKAIANPANELLANATFTGTNLCVQEPFPCEVATTMCINSKGRAVCSCKEGYISSPYSNSICKACPSGQKAVGDECQPCAFGYAGFNCNDSALLAVVVISCVLGGVLLIIVLALLIYCCWRGCPKSEPDHSSSPYSSGDLNKPWPTGITPIPRASTNCDAAPPIEMSEGGSTSVLVDRKHQTNGLSGSYDLSPEGMNTFKGRNPSRYSYLVQGHENPYFLPGDDNKEEMGIKKKPLI
ncbi:mucin-2 isoform X2 [Anoplopoma fimbria]|uniref:mucin-2 isoform X2 n=1 Tax=Anoplopoma fimbria TaxID=229290 RepID=UPI0023EB1663|nr:mucin-2 isoform X2 [Anoplopoma fimbria]